MIENLNIYFSDEEKELFPEKFSISDFNCNLSNIGNINIDETNENQNPSPLNNSFGNRLTNLEKLLDQELSQANEDPVKENTDKIEKNDKNDIRLSKMNEKEAALYYENRRKELFKGFTQHQTQIKNSKNKANVIEKTPNLKEFIVYNQFPQTKTLRKSCSTPYNYNLKQQFSKGAIDKKPIQLNENPSQASTASSSKYLKEKKSFTKKESFYQKKPQHNNNNEKQADLKASSKINYSNQKNKEKSKNFTPLPSAEKFKKPLISYSDRKIGTVNRDLKSSAIKKSLIVEKKKTKVLTIDLKELRKKISETNFKPQCFSLKNFDKNVGKIVKNGRNSRECSLILEEGVKRIEEDFNRSRSFSFNSYGGIQT